MVTMATAMDTTTNSPKMISSQATTAIMDSTVTQATGHKTTSNQHHHTITQTINTYLHRPIHLNLNHNLNAPTTHTFHHPKIKIAQMAMETAISTHKAAIDTRKRASIQLNLNYNYNNNVNQVLNTVDKKRTNQDNNTKYDDANYSFRLRSTILPFSNFVTIN